MVQSPPMEAIADLEVIHDPAAAVVALDPIRTRLLSELGEPGSAASLASRVGLARQKVNYHLRALEAHGLVRPVEERRWGGLVARYVIALAARIVREVAELLRGAKEQGKQLATLAIDTEVRFRSPAERAAFTAELTQAIAGLVARYHDAAAPGGRAHRLVLVAHPSPRKSRN